MQQLEREGMGQKKDYRCWEGTVPGICFGVELAGHDVFEQFSSGDAENKMSSIQ